MATTRKPDASLEKDFSEIEEQVRESKTKRNLTRREGGKARDKKEPKEKAETGARSILSSDTDSALRRAYERGKLGVNDILESDSSQKMAAEIKESKKKAGLKKSKS